MNLWLISKYASLPKYGAASRFFYLAEEFAKLGHNVNFITSNANHLSDYPNTKARYNYEEESGVNICWIKTKKYRKTKSISRVFSWLSFEWHLFRLKRGTLSSPDVVLVSSLSLLTIIYGYYIKRRYRAMLIFEVRDIWPLTMTAESGFSSFHPLVIFLSFIEKFGYKRSDMIVGTMPNLKPHVENVLGKKLDQDVFCSPIGFDKSNVQIISSKQLDEHFQDDKIVVGYAGSMGESNALSTYIECIKQLRNENELKFIFVGDGDLRESYIRALHGCENVIFIPKIPQHFVQYFLSKCDILYLSTHDSAIWKFGQSMNKMVQYMLSGKPIIASYSGYPSMLNEADCGCFIPCNDVDALQSALKKYAKFSSEERQKIGHRGLEWILKYRSYEYLARQYENKIIEGRKTLTE